MDILFRRNGLPCAPRSRGRGVAHSSGPTLILKRDKALGSLFPLRGIQQIERG